MALIAVATLALAGCGPAPKSEHAMVAETAAAGVAAAPPARDSPPPAEFAPVHEAPKLVPLAPLMAYAYTAELEAPSARIEPMMEAHVAACRAAGPALCTVLSSLRSGSDDAVQGALSLRAEPKWLDTFRGRLASDVKAANGRVISTGVLAEDLTRSIYDVEARLRAQKTLRDRLQQLLRDRPGKLADLLETERELARVQGDIDSAESQLVAMRQRVDMSTLDLDYRSAPTAVSNGTFMPVRDALAAFVGNFAEGLASLITFVGYMGAWILLIGPALWFGQRWLRRRKVRPPNS